MGTGQNLDFDAPDMESAFNIDTQDRSARDYALGMGYRSEDLTNEAIASRLGQTYGPTPGNIANAALTDQVGMQRNFADELSTPQTETYTVMEKRTRDILDKVDVPYDMQAAYMGDWEDKIGVPRSVPQQKTVKRAVTEMVPVQKTRIVNKPVVSMPLTRPAVRRAAPEGWNPGVGADGWGGYTSADSGLAGFDQDALGSAYDSFINDTAPETISSFGPFGWSDKTGLSIGGFKSPVDAIKGGLGFTSLSPQQKAPTQSPGFLDSLTTGWSTPGLFGGALGLATGGPLGAIAGYQGGKYGAQAFNGLGDFLGGLGFGAPGGWDNWDADTYGYGPGYNARGERSHTGRDDSGNASRGDGSYSESSGRNDNSPQGIL
jgi:hypothetical protein